MEATLRAAESHRDLDHDACAAFVELAAPPPAETSGAVGSETDVVSSAKKDKRKPHHQRAESHTAAMPPPSQPNVPSARKRVFDFYSASLKNSERLLLQCIAKERGKRAAAEGERAELTELVASLRAEVADLRSRLSTAANGCRRVLRALDSGDSGARRQDRSQSPADVVDVDDERATKRKRGVGEEGGAADDDDCGRGGKGGRRRAEQPPVRARVVFDEEDTPQRPSTSGGVRMNDLTQAQQAPRSAEKPYVSLNEQLMAALPPVPMSAEQVAAAVAAVGGGAVTADYVCDKCGEEGGDLLLCSLCRKFFHEMCAGPHPDEAAATRMCRGCKINLGIESDEDDMMATDSESSCETDDTDLSGFLVDDDEECGEEGEEGEEVDEDSEPESTSSCEILSQKR